MQGYKKAKSYSIVLICVDYSRIKFKFVVTKLRYKNLFCLNHNNKC